MHNTDEMSLFSARAQKGLCSHAYIVDGASGIGKLDFALHCARAMLCTEKTKPCGYCDHCRKALGGDHPDIFIIGRDKTAAISDVRELIRRSGLKPNDADKQIFIVCNAGKLRADSQNALLKLFEEPPESVAIFLLTESRSSLLPTVLSRGQRIHLDGMRDEELSAVVRRKHPEISRTELETVLAVASGNLGVAEKYLSKESAALRAKAEKLLISALRKQNYEVSSMLLLPKYKREQLHALLGEFAALINDALKQKYGAENALRSKSPEIDNANKKALAYMSESAVACMKGLENNANVTAAASKLAIDLLRAAAK